MLGSSEPALAEDTRTVERAALDPLLRQVRAAAPAELVIVLLVDAVTGRLTPVVVDHRDGGKAGRRGPALAIAPRPAHRGADPMPRLPGATGRRPELPHDRGSLPLGIRTMLVEACAGPVVVAPIAGRVLALGVVVVARLGDARSFTVCERAAVAEAADRCARTLELSRLADEACRGSSLVQTLDDAVIAIDANDVVTGWNPAAERIYGVAAADAVGRSLGTLVTTTFPSGDEQSVRRQVMREGVWQARVRQTVGSGRVVDIDSRVVAVRDDTGRFVGLLAINRDVTELMAVTATAEIQSRFAREIMEAMDSRGAVLDRDGRVLSANARWRAALGDREPCVCGPVAEGQNWLRALRTAQPEAAGLAAEVAAVLRGDRATARAECRCPAGGTNRATAIEVVRVDSCQGAAIVMQSDVSWRRRMQDELSFRATHDELTGLPNRAALMEVLAASLKRLEATGAASAGAAPTGEAAAGDGSRDGSRDTPAAAPAVRLSPAARTERAPAGPGEHRRLAVLFCDLDGFKDINDGLGHSVGDQVLVAVARRLRRRCRSADVVARFGGDEFVVVLSIDEIAQAVAMADRIVEVLGEPIVVGDVEVAPGVSVGVTVVDAPPDGDDPVGTLLRDADTAMYHAKGRGRGRYEFFDARLRENTVERLELAAALHRAVSDDELTIQFQTLRHCGDRQVAGVEALLQWRHPVSGLVKPEVFIPIAERTGRIVELGTWVLRRALAEFATLPDQRLTLAVNLSPRQLTGARLADTVGQALADSGVDPGRLVLEITEGAFVDDPVTARAVLTELRSLGVAIALDDFGTGWSSLSYLRTLPVDVLKIDRSFVKDLPTDLAACAAVSAVLGLGHGMGLVVVAEGVEREEHLAVLRDMGCDEYQGFIDGRPGPLGDVLAVTPPGGHPGANGAGHLLGLPAGHPVRHPA
jgi:diguanylate cyclase (GGDEF)-like protein/PAS domain S-box-containing protein